MATDFNALVGSPNDVAYQKLMEMYRDTHGGQNPMSGDEFNNWAGGITRQFGVQNWEDLPADFAQRYNPAGTQPFPPGSNVNQTTGRAAIPDLSGAVAGGNYNQVQAGNQAGGYNSTGATNQTVDKTSSGTSTETGRQSGTTRGQQDTMGTTVGQTNTSGTNFGNTQGTSNIVNTGTTGNVSTGTNASQTTGSNTGTNVSNTYGQTAGTNTSNTTGTTLGTTTGTTAQKGVTTGERTVTAPGDFTQLVAGQLPGIAATDAERAGFLTDFMKTGGTGLNSQVDQAVRQSLTGPQTTGAGDSARARMGGYAAAEMGRRNADQRLAAAGQLAGPTGLGTATGAFAPLFGAKTTGTEAVAGTNTGVSQGVNTSGTTGMTTGTQTGGGVNTSTGTNTSGTTGTTSGTNLGTSAGTQTGVTGSSTLGGMTSNTGTAGATTGSATNTGSSTMDSSLSKLMSSVDFQKLVGNETGSGSATGSSASAAAGNIPEGKSVSSGGCVVCTAYVVRDEMKPGAVRRAVRWKTSLRKYDLAVKGYMVYGPPIARLVIKSDVFARLFRPIARSILYHEIYLSAPTRLRKRVVPQITHLVFDLCSRPVGLLSRWLKLDTGVRCPVVKKMMVEQKLSFPL